MVTSPPVPPEMWARTPPEAQAYIRVLEAHVASLEVTVQAFMKRVPHDPRTSLLPTIE